MKAVDTNILVRYVLRDHAEQTSLAEKLLSNPCFAPLTVMLEVAWVLTSLAGRSRPETSRALLELLDLPTLTIERPDHVRWAIGRYEKAGADLADMLHLIASLQAESFITFDRRMAKAAGPNSPVPVETLS